VLINNRQPGRGRVLFIRVHRNPPTMTFAETLKQLPAITHLSELHLIDSAGGVAAVIENKPGKAGSVAVYNALAARHGGRIDVAAAEEGLALYAEHTADARANPGKHPNIERLLEIIRSGQVYAVRQISTGTTDE
jgi:hypothetical protein